MTVNPLSPSLSRRAAASPALHFLIIGLAMFALRPSEDARARNEVVASRSVPITIGADQVARVRKGYVESFSAPPDAQTLDKMIRDEVDDEILYREALAIGMDLKDPVVYQRLLEKMEFLDERHEGESDRQTFERALDLGLQSQDPIIRNTLIRKITTWIRFATDDEPPSEQELRDYLTRHSEEYRRPDATGFVHAFFNSDKRGKDGAETDARQALSALQAMPGSADLARHGVGDPFLQGIVQATQSELSIARNFGPEFAREISAAEQGRWVGPLPSPYGFHLVYVTERRPGGIKEFESVRSQVERGRETERRDERLEQKLVALREVYTIEIAALDAEVSDAR